MAKREYTEKEKAILRKKKALREKALKEKQANENKSEELLESERIEKLKLITDEESKEISKELKNHAIASFAKYDFYKDGYKKTLGILIFLFLTFLVSCYALVYASMIYKPSNAYLPVDEMGRPFEPSRLTESIHTNSEIIDFASEAYRKMSDYNYVNLDRGYVDDLRPFFTEKSLAKYKKEFLSSNEPVYVRKNNMIVQGALLNGARFDKERTEKLKKESRRMAWVVELNTIKIYQTGNKYYQKKFTTYIRIVRVKNELNPKGIAVHSVVEVEKK